jgi:ATP-dependent Lon protease
VAYATECRRRVKEQMNKRKPDDEFARINLSYFKASGEEVVVFCPESKDASATQEPARRRLNQAEGSQPEVVGCNRSATQPASLQPECCGNGQTPVPYAQAPAVPTGVVPDR